MLKAAGSEPIFHHVSHRCAQPRSPRWVRIGATLAFLGSAGCGSPEDDHPPPPASAADLLASHVTNYDPSTADSRDRFALGSCEEGTTQSCRVYLPEHNGVQPCFVGTQTCSASAWSTCGNAVLVDANANDSVIDADEVTR